MKLYQLTRFNVQSDVFKRVADKAVATCQTWQDICVAMTDSTDANIDYALAAMTATGSYSFHNSNGEFCEVRPHLDSTPEVS